MSEHPFAFQHIESKSRPRFLPIMITRLLLSLKKAGSQSEEYEWSFGGPTTHTTIKFVDCRLEGGVATRDEISLNTFSGARERTYSQE